MLIPPPKRCVIIDDEPAAHYVLVNYIEKYPRLELVQQFYNGVDALNFLREHEVDLLFLDIDMPELSGLDLLKILPSPTKTILTTAYSEYALESYDYGVIDYLLKPIYLPRFLKAIDRFFSMENPGTDTQAEETVTSLNVKVDGYFIDIELSQILYLQSLGNYVKIFTKSKTYLASSSTNEIQQYLPEHLFKRVHKSYIVALDKISQTDKDIIFINKVEIPIGITYRSELKDLMKEK